MALLFAIILFIVVMPVASYCRATLMLPTLTHSLTHFSSPFFGRKGRNKKSITSNNAHLLGSSVGEHSAAQKKGSPLKNRSAPASFYLPATAIIVPFAHNSKLLISHTQCWGSCVDAVISWVYEENLFWKLFSKCNCEKCESFDFSLHRSTTTYIKPCLRQQL